MAPLAWRTTAQASSAETMSRTNFLRSSKEARKMLRPTSSGCVSMASMRRCLDEDAAA